MSIFFKKVIVLCLPFLVIFAFPIVVQYISGEFVDIDTVIQKQSTQRTHIIYGPAYGDQTAYYKTHMVMSLQPDVLALGNSKILTMRQEFFNPGIRFYNAGGMTGDIQSFRKFIEFTNSKPKVIIMTVEPLHFDPLLNVDISATSKKFQKQSNVARIGTMITSSWVKVYTDYFSGKFTVDSLLKNDKSYEPLGLQAYVTGSGNRNDGSYHYGSQYENTSLRDEKINKAIIFIATKNTPTPPEFFSTPALTELDAFLALCKERGIYVVGYIPPTPKKIEDEYKKHSSYDYVQDTYKNTSPLFKKYGFEVFDFYSMKALGAGDDETIDEYHTSEKVMLRVMLQMVTKNKVMATVSDKKMLTNIFNSSTDQNNVVR